MRPTSRTTAAAALALALLAPAVPAAAFPAASVAQEDTAPAASSSTAEPGASTLVNPRKGATAAPSIHTKGWVLADLDSGAILASHNAERKVRPASTFKLLTALTVAARLSPDQPYRAVKADETAEGNRVVLYNGLTYKVKDLLHAALLPSANDAADALARANGGLRATVEQMQAEAARLGATHTTVVNPSGLDAAGQFTTPLDMALIGRAALANEEIANYLALDSIDFPGKRTGGKRVIYPIYNHNRMLTDGFDGALGGKSGYTSKAGRTFVAAAERDGHRLLVSLYGIGGNTYTTAEKLLDWGLANADRLEPVGQLAEPSAAAPVFERAIVALPKAGQAPKAAAVPASAAADAPIAPVRDRGWGLPSLPTPSLPSPLTLMTLLMGVLVALRARVYWVTHRARTGWVPLEEWATAQARSARHRGPADRRVRPSRSSGTEVDSLATAGG